MQQVADWLEKLGLGQYAQRFAENDVDFAILGDLTDQDLEKIGVASLGHRRKLLRAIASLNDTPPVASPAHVALSAPQPIAITSPTPAEPVGERRHVTVLFCDLVGSTGIAAKLDAEEWRDLGRLSRCRIDGSHRDGREDREETGRRADGTLRLPDGAGERCRTSSADSSLDPEGAC
jgi:SAM domain (Sterile alpha motif)